MTEPRLQGSKKFADISIETIAPFIDWVFFFKAWGIPCRVEDVENYCGCEACRQNFLNKYRSMGREKAQEALSLFTDATAMLRRFRRDRLVSIRAKIMFVPARSQDEGIMLLPPGRKEVYLPMLRQQHRGEKSGACVSCADFVSPRSDYVGLFALTVSGGDQLSDRYKWAGDMYNSILVKSLCDRLAEATSEWLHQQVRTTYWGYAPGEAFTPKELMTVPYKGIRPAIGYPSIPDLSLIFRTNGLLHMEEIGIKVTEHGAMRPNASISGLYISHPQSFYFMVGQVGEDQLADYARRSGTTVDELRPWLVNNIKQT